MKTIGFIGLGTMGRDMALNLSRAGFHVRGYDIRTDACEELEPFGIRAATSVAEAAREADAVVTMLPDTPDVEAVVYGEGGLIANSPPGKLVIDMSTIAPEAVRRMHADLAARDIDLLDAPVSGGPVGAKNATLSIMVGGRPEAFERAKPVFAAMGKTITRVGDAGAGQTVKLCNQLVCGVNIQAICEAIALARASALNDRVLGAASDGAQPGDSRCPSPSAAGTCWRWPQPRWPRAMRGRRPFRPGPSS